MHCRRLKLPHDRHGQEQQHPVDDDIRNTDTKKEGPRWETSIASITDEDGTPPISGHGTALEYGFEDGPYGVETDECGYGMKGYPISRRGCKEPVEHEDDGKLVGAYDKLI